MGDFAVGTLGVRRFLSGAVSLFRDGRSNVPVIQPMPATLRPSPLPSRPPRPPRRLRLPSRRQATNSVRAALAVAVVGFGGHWLVTEVEYSSHNSAGNADYGRGDWGGAVEEYSQMVALKPQEMDAYSLRAMAYYKMERYRLAARDDRDAIARSPDIAENLATLWQNLGYCDDYSGDHARAIADFTEAIRLDPSVPDTEGWTADAEDDTGDSHKGRLWAYYAAHQYQLAIEDCDALIARHPYPSNYAVRGKLRREAGQVALAMADFATSIRMRPRQTKAYIWEGEMLERRGRMAEALGVAEQAVRNNPSSVLLLGGLGFTQYETGRYAQAVATDQAVLARDASQNWARFNLALTYAAQGDWAKAGPAYADALRRSTVADRCGALGDVRKALARQPHSAAMRQALALFPKDAGSPLAHED